MNVEFNEDLHLVAGQDLRHVQVLSCWLSQVCENIERDSDFEEQYDVFERSFP